MPTGPVRSLIEHIGRAVPPEGDGELLGRFVERRDERALTALVDRHGPMVWGVCRRLLSHQDAEDAFQATFLVLVRKAGSVEPRGMVGNWLCGVARQAALQARAASRRRAREVQVTELPDVEAPQDRWADVRPILDEELSRLPDRYRGVIVLCDLEGRTRKEVASQIGCPEGTVASRLARARGMLARRLTGRGVALSAGALVAALSRNAALAGVPASVVASTIKAASLFAAGQAVIPVKAAALAEGVVKAMFVSKIKAALSVMLILGFVATGATLLTYRVAAGQDDRKATVVKPVEPAAERQKEKDKEAFTAWGKEIGGLQAGLGFRPGERRAYRHGEEVTLVVRVRNVGKGEVKFQYLSAYFKENWPTVTDADNKPVPQPGKAFAGGTAHLPNEVSLPPGKEVELAEVTYELRPASDWAVKNSTRNFAPLYGGGKVGIQYESVFGDSSLTKIKPDPTLSKLATGKLELEIKAPVPIPAGEQAQGRGGPPDSKLAYPTADVVVQYRDESGRDLKQFRVEDAETVAELASHFPGILGDRGSGPRASAGKRATLTIKFNHESGEASQMRVAHVTADFATWWWRDNTPYTGDRQVEGKDKFRSLMERLAAKNKVDLK